MSDRNYLPYWTTIAGEIGRGGTDGHYFAASQGEHWQLQHRNYSSIYAQMFIVQVSDGTWLAGRSAYQDEPRYPTREEALAASAAHVTEQVTWASRDWKTMSVDQANFIIEWACGIANTPPPAPLKPPPQPEPKGQLNLFGRTT